MNRIVLVYFASVLALFTGSCGDEGGTCPSGPVESFAIADGEYRYVPERSGELEYGRPVFGTLWVDKEARTAAVEYEMEDGSIIREEYEFSSPEKIIY